MSDTAGQHGDLVRVVVEGIGDHYGAVASSPTTAWAARMGLASVRDVFAADIAAGQVRVGVMDEQQWAQRVAADPRSCHWNPDGDDRAEIEGEN
jgi:hypothetical protein